MSIEITAAMADRLTSEARRLGISVEAFLQRLIDEHEAPAGPIQPHASQPRSILPLWHLGQLASLHRRDIYDDVH